MQLLDDVPVLSDIVKAGDENIIKSARRDLLESIDALDLELQIDQIINRHVDALRVELRILLHQK